MKNLFLNVKLSKLLKEKGFDEECLTFYNSHGKLSVYMNPDKDWNSIEAQVLKNSKITMPNTYCAPTHQQVINWFLENYNICIEILIFNMGFLEENKFCFQYRIYNNTDTDYYTGIEYKTTEETTTIAIEEALKLI